LVEEERSWPWPLASLTWPCTFITTDPSAFPPGLRCEESSEVGVMRPLDLRLMLGGAVAALLDAFCWWWWWW